MCNHRFCGSVTFNAKYGVLITNGFESILTSTRVLRNES